MSEDGGALAGAQCIHVVDAITTGEHGVDHRHRLLARIRAAGNIAEVEVLLDQLAEAQMLRQRSGEQQPGVGHQTPIIEGDVEPVEGVGSLHLTGAPWSETLAGVITASFSVRVRHLSCFQTTSGRQLSNRIGGSGLSIALDAVGDLNFADASNFRIRKVDTTGVITTIAGRLLRRQWGRRAGHLRGHRRAGLCGGGSGRQPLPHSLVLADRSPGRHLGHHLLGGRGRFQLQRGRASHSGGDRPSLGGGDRPRGQPLLLRSGQLCHPRVDASGHITTVAGNGYGGYSGDGGPAIVALLRDARMELPRIDRLVADAGRHRRRDWLVVGPLLERVMLTARGRGRHHYSNRDLGTWIMPSRA